ncbi:hypothetical protein PUMCH_001699 [Australozyma saopauloensis]|uniref:Uncharacterized protein n=1 Tax=Australozyma saopauloensis TaxID=291208 RepID=A0AAX4H7C7_9ASCO|nr:hypothetical protein PUMCH_001699 [[Candida] saopauloensis]
MLLVVAISALFCCGALILSFSLARRLNELFTLINKTPRKPNYDCDLTNSWYLVANGSSRVGRKVLLVLAERGAHLYLMHSSEEKKMYKKLASNLRRRAKHCTVTLKTCDLLLQKSIDFFASRIMSKLQGKFTGFLYFTTESNSSDSSVSEVFHLMNRIRRFIFYRPDMPRPRVVFASNLGASPFSRDQRWDRALTCLEHWQDTKRYFGFYCTASYPQVTFANTGCIWNGSESSFAFIVHWLCHKINVRMPCQQEEHSVLFALLLKEKENVCGIYFVNDSEWCKAPQFERLGEYGKKILNYIPNTKPEGDALRGSSMVKYFGEEPKLSPKEKSAKNNILMFKELPMNESLELSDMDRIMTRLFYS